MISTLDVSTQCQWKIRLFVDYASMIKTNPRNFEGISININFSKTTQIEKKTIENKSWHKETKRKVLFNNIELDYKSNEHRFKCKEK